MVIYGQVIVGPPGSGKTTYCCGMKQFLGALGRKCEIVNIDFANDLLPYEPAVDVRELISLERVMDELKLGPNGGLVYCMEYLCEHIEWIQNKIAELDCNYILIDCPGQVELFSHHNCVHELLEKLAKGVDLRLCSVHLIDSYYCTDPATFISATLLVLTTMLRLQLPHVGVLSKIDLLSSYGPLPFNLDFFTEMSDLNPLTRYIGAPVASLPFSPKDEALNEDSSDDGDEVERPFDQLEGPLQKKYKKMTSGLCDFLNDFGLISFIAMNIEDGETVGRVLAAVDKANGYRLTLLFASSEAQDILKERKERGLGSKVTEAEFTAEEEEYMKRANHLFKIASQHEIEPTYHHSIEIMERYLHQDEDEMGGANGGGSSSLG